MDGREISDARECANVRVVPTCKRTCNVNVTDEDEEKEEEEERRRRPVIIPTTSPLYGRAGNNGHGTIVAAIMGHDKSTMRSPSHSEEERDVICDATGSSTLFRVATAVAKSPPCYPAHDYNLKTVYNC
ncbi:Uncharacterized protein DBV15_07007 [Temnothorax longispinosus]|uniref:Uncharacterized protein n=1 Tax=Temnothorax longispinosus TaxID=300112 RepID=A0A4S2JH03_9HYME|nr:Uncharacterized protein DBV15_07007 [Temnothorax longispinosus]